MRRETRHRMLCPSSGAAWDEIAHDLAQFESQNGFIDSWEMIVGVGIK
jgi:hypothetical protein